MNNDAPCAVRTGCSAILAAGRVDQAAAPFTVPTLMPLTHPLMLGIAHTHARTPFGSARLTSLHPPVAPRAGALAAPTRSRSSRRLARTHMRATVTLCGSAGHALPPCSPRSLRLRRARPPAKAPPALEEFLCCYARSTRTMLAPKPVFMINVRLRRLPCCPKLANRSSGA